MTDNTQEVIDEITVEDAEYEEMLRMYDEDAESSIPDILARREYTGCTVNFKTYTNSIWDKTTRENPAENQAIFYNTQPAIIDIDTFEKVQEIREQGNLCRSAGQEQRQAPPECLYSVRSDRIYPA